MPAQAQPTRAKTYQAHLCDVAIVGAGPAGLSFALCLADSGLNITLIDQQPIAAIADPKLDGRDIAMNHLSKSILTDLGVWQRFGADQVHPLNEAKVIDGHSPYALHFHRDQADNSDAPLGFSVANSEIRRAL